jgi:hypothetical protein
MQLLLGFLNGSYTFSTASTLQTLAYLSAFAVLSYFIPLQGKLWQRRLYVFVNLALLVSTTTLVIMPLVQRFDFPPHQAQEPIQELGVDGGKVRLRTPLKEASIWRDYKALETDQGVVAALHNNAQLIDWVNGQSLSHPLICLGDGHDGIWNIIEKIGLPEQRREILDWYHLNENLQKVGGVSETA